MQKRISRLDQIYETIDFFESLPDYKLNLFENNKSKSTLQSSCLVLKRFLKAISSLSFWTHEVLCEVLDNISNEMEMKNLPLCGLLE